MARRRTTRHTLLTALALAVSACATAHPFERHTLLGAVEKEPAQESVAPRAPRECPVVLSNLTDVGLDARYVSDGVSSPLGLIPAGGSLSFGVSCAAARIEAYAEADGGLLGDGYEYLAVARPRTDRPTRMGFTVTSRIR